MIGLLSALAIQTAAPDYAQQMQDLVRLASATGVCEKAGYAPVTSAELERIAEREEERMREAGLSQARIDALRTNALAVEGNRLERALDLPSGIPSAEMRQIGREARAFLFQRCSEAKTKFPNAFGLSDAEGVVFLGWIGLWIDHPLIEEVEFYLSARGACSTDDAPFDAGAAALSLARPFADDPAHEVLVEHYEDVYREGIDMAPELDATQCRRLRASADRALAAAWSAHFGGSAPYPPLG